MSGLSEAHKIFLSSSNGAGEPARYGEQPPFALRSLWYRFYWIQDTRHAQIWVSPVHAQIWACMAKKIKKRAKLKVMVHMI